MAEGISRLRRESTGNVRFKGRQQLFRSVWVEKKTSKEEVNAALKKASESGSLKGYLGYEEHELVSSDFKGDSRSSIVDAPCTLVVGDRKSTRLNSSHIPYL